MEGIKNYKVTFEKSISLLPWKNINLIHFTHILLHKAFITEYIIIIYPYVQCVPRKGFGSADCDTKFTIYLPLCTQSADPNPFRGTHCITYTTTLCMFGLSCV